MALKFKDPWGDDRSIDQIQIESQAAGASDAFKSFVKREMAGTDTGCQVNWGAIAEAARRAGYSGATAAACRVVGEIK